MFSESGWHTPPPDAPPPEPPADVDEPHRGLHPMRRGAAAAWVVVGLFMASPLLIAAAVAYFWWRVLLWLTHTK